MLEEGGAEPGDRLSFVAADLMVDAGLAGRRHRLHLCAARGAAVNSCVGVDVASVEVCPSLE